MKHGTVIIIPLCKIELNEYEKMSICNTIDNFKDIYDIYYICGKSFDFDNFYELNNFDDYYKINYIYYDDECFESINSYNNLLLSKEFYEYFVNDYKYMLIAQTDSYIFNKEKLQYFINKQYNFIGAPVVISNYFDCLRSFKRGFYYNGGLSLRNIQFCIDCLNDNNFIDIYLQSNSCHDEDLIFSSYEQEFYNSPDFIDAFNFSMDNQIYLYLPIVNFEKPFGVHHFWNNDDNDTNKLDILKYMKWINIEEKNTDTTEV